MEYIIFLILLLVVVTFGYLLFKTIKWIFSKKNRKKWTLSLIRLVVIIVLVNKVFFEKMEFVQSKVYPNLFLIKHPIKNNDSLNKQIKNKILNVMKDPFISNNDAFKFRSTNKNKKTKEINYTLRFYEYTTAWGFTNGTVHFIENKQDPGGFSSEELNNYDKYQMAYFNVINCKNDSLQYIGKLTFFKEGNEVKTDTIINLCKKVNY